jgi:putative cardiolipin synthase
MNFDQRSERINTEIGLIIGSPELAQQAATRFDEMVKPENCFHVELSPESPAGGAPHLVWHTQQAGQEVVYSREPARSGWQRFKATLLSWLPIEHEL